MDLFSLKWICFPLLMLQDVALLTDGRFSGGSHGFVVGHVCPEAQVLEHLLSIYDLCPPLRVVCFLRVRYENGFLHM